MGSVWLITGAQAAGKSTVADLLARRHERGVHIRGGQFYRWAVRGWVQVGDADAEEARRLLDLRYELSSTVADGFAAAGFTTVVQDNIYGADVDRFVDRLRCEERYLVVLRPSIEIVERRDAERQRLIGKVAYRDGFTPVLNDELVASTRREFGLRLDTSAQTPEASVDEILARRREAMVR